MIQIDTDGLTLCTIQGRLFEQSINKSKTSSSIFVRRYMNSQIVETFDSKDFLNGTINYDYIFDIIEKEYGASEYGSNKYNGEVLYWMGYFYRYFAYTYELSSKQVYKILKPDQLSKMYYVYHTFDCAYAIKRFLDENNIYIDEENQNQRLLRLIQRKFYEENIVLKSMNFEHANKLLFKYAESKESYIEEKMANYGENTNNIALTIIYKECPIGEVFFKNIENNKATISIVLTKNKYKNKGIGTISLLKAIEYAKDILKINELISFIPKSNEKAMHIFEKLGFKYWQEDNSSTIYKKSI